MGKYKYIKIAAVFVFILFPIWLVLHHRATPPQQIWMTRGFLVLIAVAAVWIIVTKIQELRKQRSIQNR